MRASISFFALGLALSACNSSTFSGKSGATTNKKGPSGSSGSSGTSSTDKDDKFDPGKENKIVYVPVGGKETIGDHPGPCKPADASIASCTGDTIGGVKIGTTTVTSGDGTTTVIVFDPKKPPPGIGSTTDNAEQPIRTFPETFKGASLTKPITPNRKKFFWVVTLPGNVHYFRLGDDDKVVDHKVWTNAIDVAGQPVGGTRTYVLEGGSLVATRTGGHFFFVDPDKTPQGDLKALGSPSYFQLPGVAAGERACIVSYRKDKKRYVGVGYGAGKFLEMPQDNKPPFTPQWAAPSGGGSAGDSFWGYSCFIDQKRLIYYSQWALQTPGPENKPGTTAAIDLRTLKALDAAAAAPNGAFTSTNLTKETTGPRKAEGHASYAMSGDSNGNILNGDSYYTMAYEPVSDSIWATGEATASSPNGTLNIFPAKCLSSLAVCTGFASYDTLKDYGVTLGPISALGDGHMIGMMRGTGQVFLMSLKNPQDITQGIDGAVIANVNEDPYMYTDFTGATLYLTSSENSFKFADAPAQQRGIGFTWAPVSGGSTGWKDIKLEFRCYAADATPPAYEEFGEVKDSPEQTIIAAGSCKDKKVNKVDVRLTQLNDGDSLMNLKRVQVTTYE